MPECHPAYGWSLEKLRTASEKTAARLQRALTRLKQPVGASLTGDDDSAPLRPVRAATKLLCMSGTSQ
jgi:hypothetical protein